MITATNQSDATALRTETMGALYGIDWPEIPR
jgi:hypothetical protein